VGKLLGVVAIVIAFAMCRAVAKAQQPTKVPRIGFVTGSGDSKKPGALVEAFRQGLRDLGYIEGKNILIEYRYIEGKRGQARLRGLAGGRIRYYTKDCRDVGIVSGKKIA